MSRSLPLFKSCSPCESRGEFTSGACRCIGEIAVGDVLDSFLALISDGPRTAPGGVPVLAAAANPALATADEPFASLSSD